MSILSCAVASYFSYASEDIAESLISLINRGKFDQDDAYELSLLASRATHARLRCFAWLALNKRAVLPHELIQYWDLAPESADTLLHSEFRQVRFPIAADSGIATIAELFIFTFSSPSPKAICLHEEAGDKAQALADLTGTSFLIVFSEDFQGDSWMCAALAALIAKDKNKLRRLAFTGAVTSQGKILSAGHIKQKLEAAKQFGLRLVTSVQNRDELDFWLNGNEIPVPMIQCCGNESKAELWLTKMEQAIRDDIPFFSLEVLREIGGLTAEDLLIFHAGELPFEPAYWRSYLADEVHDRFERLESCFAPSRCVFWYAGMVSSMQYAIGTIFGFKRPICICHWDSSALKYVPVIRLRGITEARYLKNVDTSPDDFRYIDWETSELNCEQKDVALIIYLGSHNPASAALRHAEREYATKAVVMVRLKESQGQILLQADWLEISREINCLINYLKQQHYWQRLLIYHTAPAAICMALGIAFGHFMSALVHHFQPGSEAEYKAMYDLKDVLRQ